MTQSDVRRGNEGKRVFVISEELEDGRVDVRQLVHDSGSLKVREEGPGIGEEQAKCEQHLHKNRPYAPITVQMAFGVV